jgi:hypothetical protein
VRLSALSIHPSSGAMRRDTERRRDEEMKR